MNYTDTKETEIKILDLQIVASFLFIITTFISILITYNEDYYLKNGKRIINSKDAVKLSKLNRAFIIILLFVFLYINYKNKEIDKIKNNDIAPDNLQIFASYLSLVASFIILYVVYKYGEDVIPTTENPES